MQASAAPPAKTADAVAAAAVSAGAEDLASGTGSGASPNSSPAEDPADNGSEANGGGGRGAGGVEEAEDALGGLSLGDASPQAGSKGGEAGGMDMDAILECCLLGGLLAVPDGELPLLTSDFYSKYMLPAKPQGGRMIKTS